MFKLTTYFILIISPIFANPLLSEACDRIEKADQKLEEHHKKTEDLARYLEDAMEEYKDVLIEQNQWHETIQQNQELRESLVSIKESFQIFLSQM
ncbi:MAG: hypothetical protein K940chlam8_01007, partial [Chlamydiae bacterium]|nr:hypothetical protein [Chlamydiota bacterium]